MVIHVSNGKAGDELHISWGSGLMTHSDARVDGSGNAYVNCSSGSGRVLINGRQVYSGYISDGLKVSK